MKTTIFIARHGETTWNVTKRIQGESDYPLTVKGYRHRRGLYLLLKDERIDIIYTSALKRTIDTAAPLAHEMNLTPIPDAALNEISFGLLEGEPLSDLDPWAQKKWEWWLKDPISRRIPGGGESYQDLKARVDDFFERQQEDWKDKRILVVGHRCINRIIAGQLAGLPLKKSLCIDQENDLIYRIHRDGRGSKQIDQIRTMSSEIHGEAWQTGLQMRTDIAAVHRI
jgi:broad specificity phosphatase PhoE